MDPIAEAGEVDEDPAFKYLYSVYDRPDMDAPHKDTSGISLPTFSPAELIGRTFLKD